MKGAPDLSIYVRAFPMLVRKPSVFVAPLLGAVVALVLQELGYYLTGPLGDIGASLFFWIANIFYSFAFGIAIIQADSVERGLRGTFESAWEEGRRKAGGIILAAIGFWFIYWITGYIGSMIGSLSIAAVLSLVAAFFLIYTIPAAAIGGLPGSLAIGGSIRAARAEPFGAAILTVVLIVTFLGISGYPPILTTLIANDLATTFHLGPDVALLLWAFLEALALGYLAFPFAKQYADIAYRAY